MSWADLGYKKPVEQKLIGGTNNIVFDLFLEPLVFWLYLGCFDAERVAIVPLDWCYDRILLLVLHIYGKLTSADNTFKP